MDGLLVAVLSCTPFERVARRSKPQLVGGLIPLAGLVFSHTPGHKLRIV